MGCVQGLVLPGGVSLWLLLPPVALLPTTHPQHTCPQPPRCVVLCCVVPCCGAVPLLLLRLVDPTSRDQQPWATCAVLCAVARHPPLVPCHRLTVCHCAALCPHLWCAVPCCVCCGVAAAVGDLLGEYHPPPPQTGRPAGFLVVYITAHAVRLPLAAPLLHASQPCVVVNACMPATCASPPVACCWCCWSAVHAAGCRVVHTVLCCAAACGHWSPLTVVGGALGGQGSACCGLDRRACWRVDGWAGGVHNGRRTQSMHACAQSTAVHVVA